MTEEESAWLDAAPWGITPRVAERLRATAEEVAREWDVSLGERLAAGRFSFVAFAGEDKVLKVVPVEDDGADHEADALALLAGDGAARLLRHDRTRRAILIERARPGHDASDLPEDEAIRVAIAAAKTLWRPAERGRPFRWIGDLVPRWLDNAGDHYLVRQAKEIYATMHPSDTTLVHGDLHHHNLLRHGDAWVVIDPKPMVGEPEFDVSTFLWNPIGHLPTTNSVERWIGAFADAGLDGNRLRKWAIVRGTYEGLPLSRGLTAETSPQLRVVRALL
ncbi:MAG: aminoglycoside phosphotransferase family protein [Chloroflexota bacterium]|nr:aminoglycoside phosphotransferase family protein [Chloroflexota bacterium]